MKRKAWGLLVAAVSAPNAGAVDFIDVAPVVSVTALYGPVIDPRDCAPVAAGSDPAVVAGAPLAPQAVGAPPPQPATDRNVIAPIAGGAAGALLGSQIGQGRGRDAAAAVGAVAGTVITDRVVNPNAPTSTTGAIVGGAAGGLLGNQVGQGSGRTAATAAGAIGGAMIGDRVMAGAQPQQPVAVPAAQMQAQAPCRVVDGVTREAVRGYSVVYRYAGRDITTTMPYHPGNSIRVSVGASDSMVAQPAPPAAYQQPAPAVGYPPAPGMVPQPQRTMLPPAPAAGVPITR
jgi:uncharacterized protein YcfJ